MDGKASRKAKEAVAARGVGTPKSYPAAAPKELEAALRVTAAPGGKQAAGAAQALRPATQGTEPDAKGPAAILVMHGMGQQIPFSTLEDVANALLDAEARRTGQPRRDDAVRAQERGQADAARPERPCEEGADEVLARTVMLGTEKAQRLEVCIGGREVHLYEAYWAPLTEGAIDLRGVMVFLWRAGTTGFWKTFRSFDRWMFGRLVRQETRHRTRPALLLALAMLGALVAFNAAIAAVAAFRAAPVGKTWPSPGLLLDLSALMAVLLGVLLLAALPLWVTHRAVGKASRLRKAGDGKGATAVGRRARAWGAVALVAAWVACVALMAGAAALGVVLWHGRHGASFLAVPPDGLGLAAQGLFFALWATLGFLSLRARRFIVQYVGDVAIYVSPQYLDTYTEKRKAIKDAARTLATAVYTARTEDATALQYSRVALVGHSLGSVVAYDTLNRLLDDDRLAGGALRVQPRTCLLLTFGSPLDKTAFIFGAWGSKKGPIREKLAASVQPLVQDKAVRGGNFAWVNVHTKRDIVSGALKLYNDPAWGGEDAARRVRNVKDTEALTPLAAHIEYWQTPAAWDELHDHLLKEMKA